MSRGRPVVRPVSGHGDHMSSMQHCSHFSTHQQKQSVGEYFNEILQMITFRVFLFRQFMFFLKVCPKNVHLQKMNATYQRNCNGYSL